MTELLTKAAYARRKGVNRSAITRAVAYGRVVLDESGLVMVEASDHAWEAMRSKAAPGADASPLSAAVQAWLDDDDLVLGPLPQPAGAMSFQDARTANEALKVHEKRMRLEKLRGEVVDRARATALVEGLARQERDSWAGWPARVAALMAADLGVDPGAMRQVLEAHVGQHLAELPAVEVDLGEESGQ